MVRGLARFKAHFQGYADRYVLIGGTASALALEGVGLGFRATKDLDIVLCVEALDGAFVRAFWDFIRLGGYKNRQRSTGRTLYYRFDDPEDETFPVMLELFSRTPDALSIRPESHLTPIPVDEGASSLSAILLDGDYYRLIQENKREIEGLPIVGAEVLIVLKARAWLDMTKRKNAGEQVDEKDIRKQRNDVFRLFRILDVSRTVALANTVKEDLRVFLEKMEGDGSLDLKSLGFRTDKREVLAILRRIYGLIE